MSEPHGDWHETSSDWSESMLAHSKGQLGGNLVGVRLARVNESPVPCGAPSSRQWKPLPESDLPELLSKPLPSSDLPEPELLSVAFAHSLACLTQDQSFFNALRIGAPLSETGLAMMISSIQGVSSGEPCFMVARLLRGDAFRASHSVCRNAFRARKQGVAMAHRFLRDSP